MLASWTISSSMFKVVRDVACGIERPNEVVVVFNLLFHLGFIEELGGAGRALGTMLCHDRRASKYRFDLVHLFTA